MARRAPTSFGFVSDSYFARLDESPGAGRYLATRHTVGPWSPQLQHGGPPNALAVRAAERLVRDDTGRNDLVAVRLGAEFAGPVPVGEVETRARVVRAARSAVLAEVTLTAAGRDCLHTRIWFVRALDTAPQSTAVGPLDDLLGSSTDSPTGLGLSFGYGDSLEWRFVRGRMTEPGPAAAWVRPTLPLVAGDEPADLSGLARAALIADSGNGISSVLDWARWSFVNVDLDIHLARPVVGEWLLLDAVTQVGPAGSALARSTLSDRRGEVGAGLQTLVVAPAATEAPAVRSTG